MATLNIPNTPQYSTLINMIERIMNPSEDNMAIFKQKLNESELALLFSAVEGNCGSSSTKKSARSVTSSKITKPRNQTKAANDDVRCEALVFAYEMNADGQLVPSRCKRCIEENTKFCKQHGAADGKPWKCKERGNVETTHEFKWQHLGTVDEPSPIFDLEKAKAELLKNFNAKQQNAAIFNSSDDCSEIDTPTMKKTTKVSKKAAEKAPKEKKPTTDKKAEKPRKRGANGYIFYKSLKHQEIKQQLMQENPEMKGKELANKITSVASEQWNLLSEVEQAQYKKEAQAKIGETIDVSSSIVEQSDDCDTPMAASEATPVASADEIQSSVEIPTVESDGEEDTLVFNEKHKVWVDTDNNLCYESKDTTPGPIGQVQRGQFLRFPTAKK
jgi:hypothetical protein